MSAALTVRGIHVHRGAQHVLRGIDLESATIPDLQRAMNRGKLSAVELTSFYLRRIRALEPKVNAVLAVNPDALRIAAAIGIDGFDHVQSKIAELMTTSDLIRACLRASEADCIPGPNGTVVPDPEPIWVVRMMTPTLYPRMIEVLQQDLS